MLLIVLNPTQVLRTDFGLVVSWNGKRNARIEISLDYWNATCGLCGVFDGEPDNDFTIPDGTLVRLFYSLSFVQLSHVC